MKPHIDALTNTYTNTSNTAALTEVAVAAFMETGTVGDVADLDVPSTKTELVDNVDREVTVDYLHLYVPSQAQTVLSAATEHSA